MKKLLPLSILSTITLMAVSCGGNSSSIDNNSSLPACNEDNKVHIVILTGQSGARGKAKNTDLTEDQKDPNYDVDIMADGLTMPQLANIPSSIKDGIELTEVQPGFGDSTGEFGPELGMGENLASLFPKGNEDRKSVIVKYTACGSTFTDHWYSTSMLNDSTISSKLNKEQIRTIKDQQTGPLTNNLFQLIDETIDQLSSEGYESVIDGAVFVHGEQDAKFDDNMDIYEKALEYFAKDLRSYVGNDNMPFVITEALTNSAKYSNKLREIQKNVASKNENNLFVETSDLYTNTFEPWHFGAESNFILGNRAIAELATYNDTRTISEVLTQSITVPLNVDVNLPTYISAKYSNDYEGLSKIKYTSSYDKTKLGEQTVNYVVDSKCGNPYQGSMTINVSNDPYVDGITNEYSSYKTNKLGDKGNIFVRKGEKGLFVSGDIDDKDIWTDGEAWNIKDMGQSTKNDDFRIYLTTSDVASRYTICLSAANLLRVYDKGVSLTDATPAKNLYQLKKITDFKYHVTTKGLANVPEGNKSNGLSFELYLSYNDLGITNPDDIKLCFAYNDISNPENIAQDDETKTRPANNVYLMKGNSDSYELDINNYFAISELI